MIILKGISNSAKTFMIQNNCAQYHAAFHQFPDLDLEFTLTFSW